MSFLERIAEANTQGPAGYLPFAIAGRRCGRLRPDFARQLARWPHVFRVSHAGVALTEHLDRPATSLDERTDAVAAVLAALHREGVIRGWRGELFPIGAGAPPALLIERAAIPHFGAGGTGVHLNGFVRRADALHMWIARRARDKPTWPGLLDQLAAGGQPAGIGLRENMIKEAAEEAAVPRSLAAAMRPAGVVSYVLETAEGLRPDLVYCFDLELPGHFVPANADGEVESFELWPIERVARTVRETHEFKFNCALVIIDFLVRHGLLDADDPDYARIVHGLRRRPDGERRGGP